MKKTISRALMLVLALAATIPATIFAAGGPNTQTYGPSIVGVDCVVFHGWTDSGGTTDTKRWFDWSTDYFYQKTKGGDEFATQWHDAPGASDYTSEVIVGLHPDTVYWYRAVAQNSTGRSYASAVSFRTPAGVYRPTTNGESCRGTTGGGTTNPPTTPAPVQRNQSVATINASYITDTSAQLNGIAFPINGVITTGFFQWGGTPDLGNTTSSFTLGSGAAPSMSQAISGLQPGTTYFFRPVIQSAYGTSYGLTYSFRTTGVSPYVPPTPTTPAPTPTHPTTGGTSTNPHYVKPLVVSPESNAAAAALTTTDTSGFLGLSWNDWMWILAHLFFILGLFFLFLFFCCRNKQEDTTPEADVATGPRVTPWETGVPQQSPRGSFFIQKSAPPTNLPV